MRDVVLSAGDVRATVSPALGGRLSALTIDGIDVLVPGTGHGSFPMAPWCGRTADGLVHLPDHDVQLPINNGPHAIHGTVRDAAWDVTSLSETAVSMACELVDPWPFRGRVTQELSLTPTHLDLSMAVTTHAGPFPAQVGWHPWFATTLVDGAPQATLEFTADWQEERVAMIPTGRRLPVGPPPWDDCFGMPGGVAVAVIWPGQLRVDVTSPAEWVVVFNERPEAVCVEPQSGPPNGLNSAPRIVTVDDPLHMSSRWAWRRLRSTG
ncbi:MULTISPECIES: aldose 1-epimerase [Gordonia]|uniref:aldose epimerase family protein n=1 Tax=Gordonia TaxID=2053 RepID=UPI0030FE78B9